jgi:hypothetical protein
MFIRDLPKGTRVLLRNGWEAELVSDLRTNTPVAKVFGDYTEIGSVYAHDIIEYKSEGTWKEVEHTPAQLKLRSVVAAMGF